MSFYAAKNVKVKINDNQFVCSDVQLNWQAQIQPNFYVGSRYTEDYSATDGIMGSLRLSYYLTGSDPLKPFMDWNELITANVEKAVAEKLLSCLENSGNAPFFCCNLHQKSIAFIILSQTSSLLNLLKYQLKLKTASCHLAFT